MTGALHLIGGGWGGDGGAWRGFVEDAAIRAAASPPRILVVAVREGDAEQHVSKLVQVLRAAGPIDAVPCPVRPGESAPEAAFDDELHGVLVGGGSIPAHLDALRPRADRLRVLLERGVPYAGFSAGAAIAPERALVGGWLHEGLPVAAEATGQGLLQLTVRDGLGLLPCTLEVHAAHRGTLGRLVAAVDAGLVEWGAAVDEDTALVVRDGAAHVEGAGSVWWVDRGEHGTRVLREVGRGEPRAPRPLARQR